MFIQGQDKDVIFPLSDKGLFKSTLYAKDIYINFLRMIQLKRKDVQVKILKN